MLSSSTQCQTRMVSVATESKLKLNQKLHWFNCLPTHPSAVFPHPHSPLSHTIPAISFCHSVIPHLISVAFLSHHLQPLLYLECTSSLSSKFQSVWITTLTNKDFSKSNAALPTAFPTSFFVEILSHCTSSCSSFPLFLLWMGLPMSYFCFSSSMFLCLH